MKVQQTLAQTWKRRRDSDHAEAKRLIEERGVGLLAVPDELLDIILGFSDLSTRFAAVQTSHQFSGSVARLSPQLEYRALRKRFPLLAIVMDADPAHAPTAPRELFLRLLHFDKNGESMDGLRLRSIRLRRLGRRERHRLRRRDGGRPVGRMDPCLRMVRRGVRVERVPLPQPPRCAPGEGRVIS